MASGSWTQSEPAVTSAESNRAAPRPITRPAQSDAKALRKPFSLAGRIIARVIICQLVLTAALTTVALVYARREVALGFDAALNGRAINTLAAVRYTETNPPDLLFDPSLLPAPSSRMHPDLFCDSPERRNTSGAIVNVTSRRLEGGGRVQRFPAEPSALSSRHPAECPGARR